MQQFQEPWILTNSSADYQLLKTRGRARSPLSSRRFVPRTLRRVMANSHELNLRILSLILIALGWHELTLRGLGGPHMAPHLCTQM